MAPQLCFTTSKFLEVHPCTFVHCLACIETLGDVEHHNAAGTAEMVALCTLLLVSAIKLACTSSVSLSNQGSICMTADTRVYRKLSWNHVAGVLHLCLKTVLSRHCHFQAFYIVLLVSYRGKFCTTCFFCQLCLPCSRRESKLYQQ